MLVIFDDKTIICEFSNSFLGHGERRAWISPSRQRRLNGAAECQPSLTRRDADDGLRNRALKHTAKFITPLARLSSYE